MNEKLNTIIAELSMHDYQAKMNTLTDSEKFNYMINGGFTYKLSDVTLDAIAVKTNYTCGNISESEYNDYCDNYDNSKIVLTVYENDYSVYCYNRFDDYVRDDVYYKDKLVVFDERKVKFGDDNPDYMDAKGILTDLDYIVEDDLILYLTDCHDVDSDKAAEIVKIYNDNPYIDKPETILNVMNVLSGNKYKLKSIRGYSQGDYAEIIYNAEIESSVDFIESMWFGKYTEVKVTESNQDEYWDIITHDDLWNKNDAELLEYFSLPENAKVVRI